MVHLLPELARSIVLRHFPRVLRAGLDSDGRTATLTAELVRDLTAVQPALGLIAKQWLAAQSGGQFQTPPTEGACSASWMTSLLHRLRIHNAVAADRTIRPGRDGLAALDAHAAAHDDATVREVADALLLLGVSGEVHLEASRLAQSAWASIDRLPEVEIKLRRLSLLPPDDQDTRDRPLDPGPEGLDGIAEALRLGPIPSGAPRPRLRQETLSRAFATLAVEARTLAIGLSAVSVGRVLPYFGADTLAALALGTGQAETEPHGRQAVLRHRERSSILSASRAARKPASQPAPVPGPRQSTNASEPTPAGHVLVCAASGATGAGKGREVARGYEHAIGRPLPLIATRDLAQVRRELLPEFPYAEDALDSILGAFAGKPFVRSAPLLVTGPPGAGKSRFVRRLGEALGVGVFRVDATNDGGATFGGTERRWYSAEPCTPFMAIARFSHANPLLLVDEIDKAPTRAEYGRIWDSMLQALEPENAVRYPDPCFQTDLDISWVSIVCTANDTARMPGPLLDRMRIVRFPAPLGTHLDELLPGLMRAIATERGVDPRFLPLPDPVEREALARRWRGGSVRRLQRAVEAVLRVRDREQGKVMQ